MHMAPFHQTEHFTGHPADLESLTIKLALKWVERGHDIRYSTIPVILGMRSFSCLGFLPDSRIGFAHHYFAEIDADQIVLENVVIEHVLRCLTQVNNPLRHCWRFYPVCHILGVNSAKDVSITTYPTNPASDAMAVPAVLLF